MDIFLSSFVVVIVAAAVVVIVVVVVLFVLFLVCLFVLFNFSGKRVAGTNYSIAVFAGYSWQRGQPVQTGPEDVCSDAEQEAGLRGDHYAAAPFPCLRAGRCSATDHRAKCHH